MLASTRDLAFRNVSAVHAQCLTWTTAGLYACGVEWLDHFVVGLSTDRGATFTALSHLSDPCPARRASGTTVDRVCTGELWRGTQTAIHQQLEACGGPRDAGVSTAVAKPLPERSSGVTGSGVARGLALLVVACAAAAVALRRRHRR